MNIKLKYVIIFQTIIIAILLAVLIAPYSNNIKIEKQLQGTKLLSPRIYSGLLEPKSFMIVNFAPLKQNLQSYITENNLNVSVYVENLRNGAFMGINERTGFFPTSLNKLPVAILIIKKIEEGELSFDSMLQIRDSDRTDTAGELYKTKEKELPLRFVLEKMLKESDNTALRILLRYVDLDDLQLLLDYYGIDITLYNQKDKEKNNLISPKSISNLFSSLYFSTVLEPENSEYILSLLTQTIFDVKKIAEIPDEITVAHKFGENYYANNRFFHDCGIMYSKESRIFYCIMTKDLDEEEAAKTMGFILNEIYNYVVEARAKLDAYKK